MPYSRRFSKSQRLEFILRSHKEAIKILNELIKHEYLEQ